MEILNIESPKTEEGDFHKKYFVRIKLEGALLPLAELIYQLQLSDQTLKVEDMNMEMKKDSPDFGASMLISRIVATEEG